MPLAIFLFLILLTPTLSMHADEKESNGPVCLLSVPKSVFDLPSIALAKAKDTAVGVVEAFPEIVDELAFVLADKLESTKNVPESIVAAEPNPADPQVLGARTSDSPSLTASAYNAGVDVLSLLLQHWMWTLSGLIVATLFWKFKS